MPLYAYSALLQKHTDGTIISNSTLGYKEAANEDEARGIAYREAIKFRHDFAILHILVMEIKLEGNNDGFEEHSPGITGTSCS